MPELPRDPELHPIARFVEGLTGEQIRTVRDNIVTEVATLEAEVATRQRTFPVHANDFGIQRDQRRCAVRRREVDYLNQLLAQPVPGASQAPEPNERRQP
jgi:hypothetical protein